MFFRNSGEKFLELINLLSMSHGKDHKAEKLLSSKEKKKGALTTLGEERNL